MTKKTFSHLLVAVIKIHEKHDQVLPSSSQIQLTVDCAGQFAFHDQNWNCKNGTKTSKTETVNT